MGIGLLNVVVYIQQGIADQFHPELFNLMYHLEHEFIVIAEFRHSFLGLKNLLCI